MQWFFVGEPLYVVVTYGTKLSLVLLYLRVWNHQNKFSAFRVICWVIAALLAICVVSCFFATLFSCRPFSYSWRQVVPGATGTCNNRGAAALAYSGLNIAFDVIVLLLPIPRIFDLQMAVHKKIWYFSLSPLPPSLISPLHGPQGENLR